MGSREMLHETTSEHGDVTLGKCTKFGMGSRSSSTPESPLVSFPRRGRTSEFSMCPPLLVRPMLVEESTFINLFLPNAAFSTRY